MDALWRPAYVAIGSNLNSPQERVLEAFERLAALPQISSLLRSRLYLTRPLGPQDQPQFVNAVAGFLTQRTAHPLLQDLLAIERDMGRVRQERWGPRIIDLDLLWMPDAAAEPGLTIPHPGVSSRNFVLYPLSDVAPTLEIPGLGSIHALSLEVGQDGLALL